MEAIKKILKGRTTLIFLDFEGTQFSHEIIAIGCCKVKCDENGNINQSDIQYYKRYVKSYGPIGKIVTNMTSISNDTLKNDGVTLEIMLEEFKQFIGDNLDDCAFLTFGSNDVKMLVDSIKISRPENEYIGLEICKRTIDFLAFISQYIRDKNGNNYSLTNYLKLYNQEPNGQSHDPLNDAIDLKNLYIFFTNDKDIIYREYLQILKKQKIFPQPIKKIINRLINNETITPDDFKKEINKFLE